MDCDNKELPLEQSSRHPIVDDEVSAVIADLSEEKQTQIRALLIREQTFQGPIPRPEHFAQYEQTLPGAADRILAMAEKEQEHRHKQEQNSYILDKSKMWVGSFLLLILNTPAVYALAIGAYSVTCIIFGTTMIAIATAYILGMKYQKEDEPVANKLKPEP